MTATGCIPPSSCNALPSVRPEASALGHTAQSAEVGFSRGDMLSCLGPDRVEGNATPAVPFGSIPAGGLTP
jgi:hypothetical protein